MKLIANNYALLNVFKPYKTCVIGPTNLFPVVTLTGNIYGILQVKRTKLSGKIHNYYFDIIRQNGLISFVYIRYYV